MNSKFSRIILLLSCVFLLTTCERIKNKTESISNTIKTKIQEKIVGALDLDKIESHPMSFNDYFKPEDSSLNIQHINGVWFDLPMGFYYCFLEYKADKGDVLNYITGIETNLPNISDSTYIICDSSLMYEKLTSFYNGFPVESEEIQFFKVLHSKQNIEFYKCAKYPNVHLFAYDVSEQVVYHFFERYWD